MILTRFKHFSFLICLSLWGMNICAQDNDSVAAGLYEKARSQYKATQFDSAAVSFQQAAEAFLEQNDTTAYLKAKERVAWSHQRSNKIKQAEEIYLGLIEEVFVFRDTLNPILGNWYKRLGNLYVKSFDVEKGIAFHFKNQRFNEQLYGYQSPENAGALINLGLAYNTSRNNEQAKENMLEALNIAESAIPPDHRRIGICHSNLGAIYNETGQHALAEEHIKKAVQVFEDSYDGKGKENLVIQAKETLAGHLASQKKFSEALQLYEDLIPRARKVWGSTDRKLSRLVIGTANAYTEIGNDEHALKYYQDGLLTLFPHLSKETELIPNPKPEDFVEDPWPMEALINKAATLHRLYEKEQLPTLLNASFETYKTTDAYIDFLRRSIDSGGSKINFSDAVRRTYEGAVQVCYDLYQLYGDQQYIDWAFQFSEKTKSIILLESMVADDEHRYSSLPAHLKEKERTLKQKITALEASDTLSNHEEQIEYTALLNQLEKECPDYFAWRYNLKIASISEIQNALPNEQTALVEYFFAGEQLFTFIIHSDTTLFLVRTVAPNFEVEVQAIANATRQAALTSESLKKSYTSFTEASYSIYSQILAPIHAVLPTQAKNLMIVPDGILNSIPFEVLLASPAAKETIDFKELDYALYHIRFHYLYSGNLLLQSIEVSEAAHSKNCLAFGVDFMTIRNAESTQSRFEISPLKHVTRELAEVKGYMGAVVVQNNQATKSHFVNEAHQYKVLHIATHAFVDTEHPVLSRMATYGAEQSEENFLMAHELSGMNLNADLAVLSACRTGDGQWRAGEGVLSLARNFIQAGCKSVVMSLWSVNDAATADVMGEFYWGLSQGLSKDEALRNAKMKFIQENDNIRAQPYYWAAFVSIGNPKPIFLSSFPFWAIGVLAGIGFLILLVLRIKWGNNKQLKPSAINK